jgi:Zn ribbon nucleic-acid-binding protein
VPWIDAGVLSLGLLARIDLYVPAADAPCLECRWDTSDYAAVEQRYSCSAASVSAAGDAPSGLGALAAALQALACQQLLAGSSPTGALTAGDQVVLATSHHRHFRTVHRRNPHCRFSDHAIWDIEPLTLERDERTLGALYAAVERHMGSGIGLGVSMAGKHFVRRATCPQCGSSRPLLRLSRSTAVDERTCPDCLHPMVVTGFGVTELLSASTLTTADCDRSLRAIGLRDGDVITAHTQSAHRHFELALRAVAAPASGAPLPAPMETA